MKSLNHLFSNDLPKKALTAKKQIKFYRIKVCAEMALLICIDFAVLKFFPEPTDDNFLVYILMMILLIVISLEIIRCVIALAESANTVGLADLERLRKMSLRSKRVESYCKSKPNGELFLGFEYRALRLFYCQERGEAHLTRAIKKREEDRLKEIELMKVLTQDHDESKLT